jgi:hypothetical protein
MTDQAAAKNEDFVNSLGMAVRDNPLPAALIGMGLVWLLTGGRSAAKNGFGHGVQALSDLSSRAAEKMRDVVSVVGASAESARDAVSSAGGSIARQVSDIGSASEASASRSVSEVRAELDFSRVRSHVADLAQRQPLLIGAVGLAIGAGLAAALRPTDAEADLLGDASAKFQEKARDFAAATADRATALAGDVATTVTEEARSQGLTTQDLKQGANEIGRKARTVVEHVSDRARSRFN